MTSSRIVRGTKTRVLLYAIAIVVLTGFLACFNSTRLELDKITKSNELCQQEEESLRTQLQMISDYKQRLEKSLKTEKAEHQQVKVELERRVSEEKLRGEKTAGEVTVRFNSLQQQYNILKTDYSDLKEKCSKVQSEQLVEINDIGSKLEEVREQLKQTERDKENSLEHLKSQIEQLQIEKSNLENQLKTDPVKDEILRLQKELEKYKGKPPPKPHDGSKNLIVPNHNENKTSFEKLIPLDSNDYKIGNDNAHQVDNNVADMPHVLSNDNETNRNKDVNDNIDTQNFLQKPGGNNGKTSTPANLKSSKADMIVVPPLKIPTVTPESVKNRTTETSRKLPDGVVPLQAFPQPAHQEAVLKPPSDAVADLVNNRYRNVAELEKSKLDEKNEIEKENGANEVLDFPEDNDEANDLPKEAGGFPKQHMGAVGDKDRVYEDYDKFPQNDDNLQENEEDDDAEEYANRHPEKEVVIRN